MNRPTDLPPEEVLGPSETGRDLVRLPRLILAAAKLAWEAGRREFVLTTCLQAFGGIALGAELLVARRLLEDFLAPSAGSRIGGSVVDELVALAVIGFLLRLASTTQVERQRVLIELATSYSRSRILDAASSAPLDSFDNPDFYNRLRRAEVNAQFRPIQLISGLAGLLTGGFGAVAMTAVLTSAHPLMVPAVIAGFIPVWLANKGSGRAYYELTFRMTPSDRERDYLGALLTGKDSVKEVRAFGLTGSLGDRFQQLYDTRIAEVKKVVRQRMPRLVLAALAASAVAAAVIGFISYLSATGRVSLTQAAAAGAAVVLLGQRLYLMGSSGGRLYEASLFLEDFRSFTNPAAPEKGEQYTGPQVSKADRPADDTPAPFFDELAAEDVWFSYQDFTAPILKGVSLTIKRGEIVALVGENGCGKSTLARLIGHLYLPSAGRILWNGMDTAELDPARLQESIAFVFQDFLRYQLPAKDNIGFGRRHRYDDLASIVEAAKHSGAHDFVSRMPAAYQTYLSRMFAGGREPSTGQWQQIALARAFFRDAPLVILDEPTADLDPQAEARLFEAIQKLWQGRSVLIISHRLSSVRSADRIYLLDQGRITEEGSHQELMQLGGKYSHLFTLQASSYLPHPPPGSFS